MNSNGHPDSRTSPAGPHHAARAVAALPAQPGCREQLGSDGNAPSSAGSKGTGLHFRTSLQVGLTLGNRVARAALDDHFQPVD